MRCSLGTADRLTHAALEQCNQEQVLRILAVRDPIFRRIHDSALSRITIVFDLQVASFDLMQLRLLIVTSHHQSRHVLIEDRHLRTGILLIDFRITMWRFL